MKRKALIVGLVGTMMASSLTPIYADSKDVPDAPEVISAPKVEKEVMKLSLKDALDYGVLNSKDMVIQRLELEKAKISYEQNKRAVKSAEKALDISIDVPRTYEVTADDNVNRALVSNGASKRSVELAFSAAEQNLAKKEDQIRYDIEKAYFDLLQMEKELSIAKENLALSQKQFNQGKLKFDLGTISQQQLLGLEMGVVQAQSMVDSTKMYYDLQIMSFQNTLGLPLNQEILLTDTIKYKEYAAIDLEKSIKLALEQNMGIKTSQESYEISELTLKAVSGRFPENTYRYKEQQVEVEKAAKNLETAKNGIEMGVKSAYLSLLTSEKQIKTFQKSVEQSQEAVRIAEVSFELGRNTSTEVNQANINLMNAKKELSKQIHAFNMALLDYEYSIK